MVGLVDIAPSTRSVRVGGEFEGGQDVAVFGVSALGIAALLTDFPALKDLMVGGKAAFDANNLATTAPGAIAAIIAAGCGTPGDKEAIKVAERLPIGDQMKFLNTILELTMPDGLGPFMEALDAITVRLGFENRGKAPASK